MCKLGKCHNYRTDPFRTDPFTFRVDGQGGIAHSGKNWTQADYGVQDKFDIFNDALVLPSSSWPVVLTSEWKPQSGGALGRPIFHPVIMEHCNVSWPTSWEYPVLPNGEGGPEDYNSTYTRTADTTVGFYTGGKGILGQRSIFCVAATATGISKVNLGPYVSPFPDSLLGYSYTSIDPAQIEVGEAGNLDSDGIKFVVWEYGVTKDLTANVSGVDDYQYVVQANDVFSRACVATTPPNRQRTSIGSGEEVTFTVSESVDPDDVKWEVAGNGEFTQETSLGTVLTAYESDSVSVTVTIRKATLKVDYQIVPPTGITYVNGGTFDPSYNGTSPFMTSCGDDSLGFFYDADLYFQPDSVNFYNIKYWEGDSSPLGVVGYFAVNNPGHHYPNGPRKLGRTVVPGLGTQTINGDTIGGGVIPPWEDSFFEWDIPQYFSVLDREQTQFTTVPQTTTEQVSEQGIPSLTLSKGGSGYTLSNCQLKPSN